MTVHAKGALKPEERSRAFVRYKHADYDDSTLFTRAYDWVKARGITEGETGTTRSFPAEV